MGTPTRAQLHQNVPLQNLTIAALQDDADFVMSQMAPFVPVEHRNDQYYEYTTGAWNRLEMQPRGTGDESAGSGWSLSTSTYTCDRWAVHKDVDWADARDADPQVDPQEDSAIWLANQARLYGDWDLTQVGFKTGVWTTEYQGMAAAPSTNELLQWNDSSSDPQNDGEVLKAAVKALIGKDPNVLLVGQDVHRKLLVNSVVRDAIKHTQFTGIAEVRAKLAAFFGVEKYLVAGAFYNSAEEGQTASLSYLLNSKDALFAYVNPNPGMKRLSAMYTFAWTADGAASDGLVASEFDIDERKVTRHEIEIYWDQKVISADAAAFVDDAVA